MNVNSKDCSSLYINGLLLNNELIHSLIFNKNTISHFKFDSICHCGLEIN